MKLQELIDQTDLDMTAHQVQAFFLGVLCAERPMPFSKAIDELLEEAPETKAKLEAELKNLWDELSRVTKKALAEMFPEDKNIRSFMEVAKDQLDFFLTGMSLSGTNAESCKDDELAELIDELEDTIADMDDYLADEDASDKDGEDFKGLLLDTWNEFVSTKK